jgi:hypothetical protein
MFFSFRLRGVLVDLDATGRACFVSAVDAPAGPAGPDNRNMQISQYFHLYIATFILGNRF